MTSPFLRRVNEALKEAIADEVAYLTDPGLGFVTITGVDTAPDLRSARIYYSVLGDADQHDATRAAMERAAGHLRRAVGRRVRLKYLPELRFEVDASIEEGMRIDRLLHELAEERSEREVGGEDVE
jgi:ribosome-binding factor A